MSVAARFDGGNLAAARLILSDVDRYGGEAAGQVEYFTCLATDKVSVLQDSAGGTLNVWPMA